MEICIWCEAESNCFWSDDDLIVHMDTIQIYVCVSAKHVIGSLGNGLSNLALSHYLMNDFIS